MSLPPMPYDYKHIPLPRILMPHQDKLYMMDSLHPLSVSIEENIIPLSTATIELDDREEIPVRAYVELFNCNGRAGIYRARSPETCYNSGTTTVELEHAIVELGDWLVHGEIKSMLPIADAITGFFADYGGHYWQLGSVTCFGTEQVGVELTYPSLLEAINTVLEEAPSYFMTFDFGTWPWTVNFAKKETEPSCEGRLSRNVIGATITYDDSEMCTRAFFEYDETYYPEDADTQGTYGIIEKVVSVDSDLDWPQAQIVVHNYLEYHKNPRMTVELEAEDLSTITGDEYDAFRIGKMLHLGIPDKNIHLNRHITGLSWPDVYGTPRSVTVTMEDEAEKVIKFITDSED